MQADFGLMPGMRLSPARARDFWSLAAARAIFHRLKLAPLMAGKLAHHPARARASFPGPEIGASPLVLISRQCAAMPHAVPAPKMPEIEAAPAARARAGFDAPAPPKVGLYRGSRAGAQSAAQVDIIAFFSE